MSLKSLTLKIIISISALSIFTLLIGLFSLQWLYRQSQKEMERTYIESSFQIIKDEVVGGLLINDKTVLKAILEEFSKKRKIRIELTSDKFEINEGVFLSDNSAIEYPLYSGGDKIGLLKISMADGGSATYAPLFIFSLFFLQIIVLSIGYKFIVDLLNKKIVAPLFKLSSAVNNRQINELNSLNNQTVREIENVIQAVKYLDSEVSRQAQIKAQVEIAKQVAHDIRSPLSALNMALFNLTSIPEDRRILVRNAVQRINDISNNLLKKSKAEAASSLAGEVALEQMAPLVDALISEKRIQLRGRSNVEIVENLDLSYGLFANVNSQNLKRVLSNLINNSIEAAVPDKKLIISLSLFLKNDKINILISDNGKGIPQEIVSKLGKSKISYGKDGAESGFGLGLSHAYDVIASFGGNLLISSELGIGTDITIVLPKQIPPSWFVTDIQLKSNDYIVSFDDDRSIHQIWQSRIKSLGVGTLKHESCYSANEFEEEYNKIGSKGFYLVDYEISSSGETGLDVIERLFVKEKGILSNTILVTSRYDEADIRNRCARLGIKLLPKAMAPYVPITAYSFSNKI